MSNKGVVRPLARQIQVKYIARRAAEDSRALRNETFPPPKRLPPRPQRSQAEATDE